MNKIQKITQAKTYLELMARSIDPTTQEVINDSILLKQETRDTLLYVVSLLNELIENDGEVVNVASPVEFQISKISKNRIFVSDQPIQIAGFVNRINQQVDSKKMKTLKPGVLIDWLINNDYLLKGKRAVSKYQTFYTITPSSHSIGIIEDELINEETGEVQTFGVKLTKAAQEFILDNLENIVGVTEGERPSIAAEPNGELNMAGQKWTEDEEQRLIHEFTQQNLTVQQIANIHHRKEGGIRARLIKLGLIEEN